VNGVCDIVVLAIYVHVRDLQFKYTLNKFFKTLDIIKKPF